ncbi:DNA-binding helix-turn-helix protein [Leptospira broomii serovar Hurstbridge str. 5399]|uniref:DNA-binding helix-turn-helix protein n=1 Tax=Leptospira broomii serovar Hurstbridge str. 5399 TaxID=1049789 RepID=T0FHS0_9LEPT|nr:metalloregulator ArsR/SmtB family transcription factor [Leptospira broomii]EQA47127.1 DNA-binding helix-turn-helix protein [Leptospira broomii serovar Hurstbridge str. 5399]
MGISKTELFNKRQNKIASYAKALGHPARIAIIESILKRKACICGDLVDELSLAQATVSQHLKALKEVGIIKGTIEGPSICYCIDEKSWKEIREYFGFLLSQNPETKISC